MTQILCRTRKRPRVIRMEVPMKDVPSWLRADHRGRRWFQARARNYALPIRALETPDATQNSNTPIIRNRTGGVIKPILFKQIVNTGLGGGFALRVPIRPHFGVSSIWKLLLFE
jgi:hypothetical protein